MVTMKMMMVMLIREILIMRMMIEVGMMMILKILTVMIDIVIFINE